MRKMIYRLCVLLLCVALLCPVAARATETRESERPGSLTLHYIHNDRGFEGVSVRIYRVAEIFPNGAFELIAPFAGYPVNIHGITSQTEWQTVATTLLAYLTADQVPPTAESVTDAAGTVVFPDLRTGVYLVTGDPAQDETGTYLFRDFLIFVPTPTENGYDYHPEAVPKCSLFTPAAEYSVVKLWKDSGNTDKRPEFVTVEILEDGILVETVRLDRTNDWSYSWTDPDAQGIWTVAEKDVPAGYRVSVSAQGSDFTITNTYPRQPDVPATGDTAPLWLYVVIFCFSGMMLMILGSIGLRNRKHEKR